MRTDADAQLSANCDKLVSKICLWIGYNSLSIIVGNDNDTHMSSNGAPHVKMHVFSEANYYSVDWLLITNY
jgi:hypothetical protein